MNIIKTVDEFTGILAVPAFSEVDEFETEDENRRYYFMAIYADRKFLDILKFIRIFEETVATENDPVTIGNIEFYPKKSRFQSYFSRENSNIISTHLVFLDLSQRIYLIQQA